MNNLEFFIVRIKEYNEFGDVIHNDYTFVGRENAFSFAQMHVNVGDYTEVFKATVSGDGCIVIDGKAIAKGGVL